MNDLTSVDFWAEELIKDTNPDHFDFHENFIPYMHDEKISSFGNWMFNNGHNVGLYNLQTKVNTYCVPQWISVKDQLPDIGDIVLIFMPNDIQGRKVTYIARYCGDCWQLPNNTTRNKAISHWMPRPKIPKE